MLSTSVERAPGKHVKSPGGAAQASKRNNQTAKSSSGGSGSGSGGGSGSGSAAVAAAATQGSGSGSGSGSAAAAQHGGGSGSAVDETAAAQRRQRSSGCSSSAVAVDARTDLAVFFTCLGFHLEWPLHCYLTFYQSLEVWAKFFHFMLWGIHLTNRCIVDLCTAVGSDISSVQMYVRQLIFQSINNSLLCFSCPPWTWGPLLAPLESLGWVHSLGAA